MRILVFGRCGQLATELRRAAPITALGREAVELASSSACETAIRSHAPDAVINAAAWTAVDAAESDEVAARAINAQAPAAMARACAVRSTPLVHVSTDYVFPGTGDAPRRPDDRLGPLGAYGRTKLAGEIAVRDAGGPHAILRTSWVVSAHGTNFVKTMLRLGASRDRLTVVADQVGGPTPADDLARACLTIARRLAEAPEASGTYHFAGSPDTSWADFARAIFAAAGLSVVVEDIPTSDWPTPARRPLNSRLDCQATEATFGLTRPDWRAGLDRILAELQAKGA